MSELLKKVVQATGETNDHGTAPVSSLGAKGVQDVAGMGIVPKHIMASEGYRMFPHFKALHPDTVFQVYREFKPLRDTIEISTFYREPGKDKMRVDAEIETAAYDTVDGVPSAHDIRITYWGPAKGAVQV